MIENPRIQINPFLEMGMGWNNRSANPDPKFITGLGLGLQWEVIEGVNARFDYGISLVAVEDEGNTLQDKGLYFSLRYQPF